MNDNVCVPFHPEMKEPIDAHSLDPETLYTFMMACKYKLPVRCNIKVSDVI